MGTVRKATRKDLSAITDIYNEAILTTVATFDTEPKTMEEQEAWFEAHGPKYPVLVAEKEARVIGWASLSMWSDRCAYADTAEISVYVKQEHRGKGVGRELMEVLIGEGQAAGLHTVIARIAEGNEVSIHLHWAFGFTPVGVMKEVGRKFGKLIDVHMMQKIYPSGG
jgi:phosphinothricin acetyltransferase